MTLFAADLYRNFAIGFVGAGLIIAATHLDGPALSSEAQASEVPQTVLDEINLADEFVIEPIAQDAQE